MLGISVAKYGNGRERERALVPAEGNFEEHPYFRVGDRNSGAGILRYEDEIRTAEGNVLKRSWTVRAAHGRGLPGRFDQDVYVALLQLLDERGLPPDGWVSFSLYELVDLMKRSHSGRDYSQVRESLQRLATTSIESENAFYHRGKKEYLTDTFSLLTEVKLSEFEGPNGERGDRNRVHLSKFFVESYRANYLKNLDAPLYWSLSSPIAKRLYRLVDKKRGGKRVWEVELFSLRDRIPLSDYRYASKIKEKLAPAHAELVEKGFLEGVVYRKGERSDAECAAYTITESFRSRRAAVAQRPRTEDELFCIQRLRAEGMETETAERLVDSYGRERVLRYVEALPHRKNLRNPAGWLRRAIEENYGLDLFSTGEPPAGEPPAGDPAETPGRKTSERTPEREPAPSLFDHPSAFETDERASKLWEDLLDDLSETASDLSDIRVWFEETTPTVLAGETLTLVTPNPVAREYIENRFKAPLEEALKTRLSPQASLNVLSRTPVKPFV